MKHLAKAARTRAATHTQPHTHTHTQITAPWPPIHAVPQSLALSALVPPQPPHQKAIDGGSEPCVVLPQHSGAEQGEQAQQGNFLN